MQTLPRIALLLTLLWSTLAAGACPSGAEVKLTVLGSGGPELGDKRASASYLVWLDGRARILVDAGPGSSLYFERSGARLEDLSAILLTHLHADHSAALPAYVKGAYFTGRSTALPVFGPAGNARMPSTSEFLHLLFGRGGAYRYLSDYLEPPADGGFHLVPHDISLQTEKVQAVPQVDDVQLQAIGVHHGPIAAVAWRVNIGGCSLVFSGDMSDRHDSLTRLARDADLLVAHNAVPQSATGTALNLHMRPSTIGEIASEAAVGSLLLSHRMRRTLGDEENTLREIRNHYRGEIQFAEPLQELLLQGH